MEVELSTIHSRSSLPPDTAVATLASVNDGKRTEAIEVNAVEVEVRDASRAPSTTFVASTPAMKRKARIQFAALCWTLYLAGWNDGTTGPLLPRIQAVYHVGFAVVSLIFVSNCLGFVVGAAANVWLTDRFGFGRVMVLGSAMQVAGYAVEAPAPPFPVFVVGYMINGFGLALQNAGSNAYVAAFKENTAMKFAILHAVYGTGAVCSPLIATQFAQLSRWSFHYLVLLGIALSNVLVLAAVFRFQDQETCLAEIGQMPDRESRSSANKYKQIFGLRALHIMAMFILLYVGIEVTLGGWIVTYIVELRGGGASSGYISSGFFGGLTLGRVTLFWLNRKVGERRAVFLYALLAISLELVVWLVPSLIGGAIAVSLVGMLMGPIYPIVMNHAGRVFPSWLLSGCIGWMAGFGQAGSAILPFLTGALASKVGIKSLQPLLVSMMGLLVFFWSRIMEALATQED
ncbi:hypothetical protein VTO73DRAFT_10893 [Trametes versicolor]